MTFFAYANDIQRMVLNRFSQARTTMLFQKGWPYSSTDFVKKPG